MPWLNPRLRRRRFAVAQIDTGLPNAMATSDDLTCWRAPAVGKRIRDTYIDHVFGTGPIGRAKNSGIIP